MSVYEVQEFIKVMNAVTFDCYRKRIKLPRSCVLIGYGYSASAVVTYFGSDPVSPVSHDATGFYRFEAPIPEVIKHIVDNLKNCETIGIIPVDQVIKDKVKEFGQEWKTGENFLLLETQRNITLRLYDAPSPESIALSKMIIQGQKHMGYGLKTDDPHP